MSAAGDKVYLLYILDALEKISTLASDPATKKVFYKEWLVQDGIIRRLQTMAETTQRLSAETKQKMPEIAWNDIAALRNILVHGYLGTIDLETVWGIITTTLPEFETKIRRYYGKHYSGTTE